MQKENASSISHPIVLSPTAFHDKANYYLSTFSHTRSPLIAIYNTYSKKQPIWPEQYERIRMLIRTLEEPVQELCKLLSSSGQLPESIIPHHYLPLATLQNTEDILAETLSLITQLTVLTRSFSRKGPSKQMTTLNAQIQRQLELLIANSEDIPAQFHALFDKTHFEAKQIAQPSSYTQKWPKALIHHEYSEYTKKEAFPHSIPSDEIAPEQRFPAQENAKSTTTEPREDSMQSVQQIYTKLFDAATHELTEIMRTHMRDLYARGGSINEVTEETFYLLRNLREQTQTQ